jgi:glycerol-3-phosphate dehydrogenase (NAD(P)+)
MIWIRDEAVAADINATHINKRYLPDFKLEDGLRAVSNIEEAVRDRDIILVAIPSHSFRDVLKQIKPFITSQAVVSLTCTIVLMPSAVCPNSVVACSKLLP